MDINTYNKESIKREILIFSLGYLIGIKNKVIFISCEYFDKELNRIMTTQDPLFKYGLLLWVKKNNFNKNFIELIDNILILEDILFLIPEKFDNELNALIGKVLKELESIPKSVVNEKSLYAYSLQKAKIDKS